MSCMLLALSFQVGWPLLFVALAVVLLLLAALGVPSHPRIQLGWFGLLFWLLSTVAR